MSITLTINDIPDYLKSSKLYENIVSDESFEVPIEYYKKEIIINNLDDVVSYIKLFDYWMITKIPKEFFKFIFDNKEVIDLHKLKNECEETGMQILPDLINDIEIIVKSENVCFILAAHGSFDAFKYAHEYYGSILNIWICHNAANNGQFEILKYAHEKGCPMN